MKETEQTLFLKSNLLHIRTNDGVFEVSNPEVVHTSPLVQFHRKWNEGDESEWPGVVELIELPSAKVLGQRGHTNVIKGKKLARLLPPKEEKKENKICIASHGPASTQVESAYKEVEGSKPEGKDAVYGPGRDSQSVLGKRPSFKELPPLESKPEVNEWLSTLTEDRYRITSEIQKAIPQLRSMGTEGKMVASKVLDIISQKPVSTPSESQEEMWKDLGNKWNQMAIIRMGTDEIVNELAKNFKITRKPE